MKSRLPIIVLVVACFLLSGCVVTAGYGYASGPRGYPYGYYYSSPVVAFPAPPPRVGYISPPPRITGGITIGSGSSWRGGGFWGPPPHWRHKHGHRHHR